MQLGRGTYPKVVGNGRSRDGREAQEEDDSGTSSGSVRTAMRAGIRRGGSVRGTQKRRVP